MRLNWYRRGFILLITLISFGGISMAQPAEQEVARTLDRLHEAASQADFASYFSLFHPTAVFLGTDASERWDLNAFKTFAKPLFAKGKGWTYKARERHIQVQGELAWFDEILDNASYGVCRGTGVLIRSGQLWQIAQYHLTIPIPNQLAEAVVAQIKVSAAKPSAAPNKK